MPPDDAQMRRSVGRGQRLVLSAVLLIGAAMIRDALVEGPRPGMHWGRWLADQSMTLLFCYGLYRGWALAKGCCAVAFGLFSLVLATLAGMAAMGKLNGGAPLGFGWPGGFLGALQLAGVAYCIWALFFSRDSRQFRHWQRCGEMGILPPPARTEPWRVNNR